VAGWGCRAGVCLSCDGFWSPGWGGVPDLGLFLRFPARPKSSFVDHEQPAARVFFGTNDSISRSSVFDGESFISAKGVSMQSRCPRRVALRC